MFNATGFELGIKLGFTFGLDTHSEPWKRKHVIQKWVGGTALVHSLLLEQKADKKNKLRSNSASPNMAGIQSQCKLAR